MTALLAAILLLAAPAQPATHALLLNGGDRAQANYQSHLHHLQDMAAALAARGVAAGRISVFSGDGTDPAADMATREVQLRDNFWLVEGTPVGRRLRPGIELKNTVWPEADLLPATHVELREWFLDGRDRIKPGDTLLVFVTDHGTGNTDDPMNGAISLWGESLSVLELRAMFGWLRPGVRVAMVMSQCHSGTFAGAMYGLGSERPGGDVCGFFSTSPDRQAYGCYPEGRGRDRIGHAFNFIEALAAHETLDAAHRSVQARDMTPDVPLATSDVFLERVLEGEAPRRGMAKATLVDRTLKDVFRAPGAWEPETRHLDRVARTFGTASPRSLAELEAQSDLAHAARELDTYAERWEATLDSVREELLRKFSRASPQLAPRLEAKALEKLDPAGAARLASELLPALERFARADGETWKRLVRLREKQEQAERAHYRMEVRLAGYLRLRTLLTSLAGRALLASGHEPEREALGRLRACESWSPGPLPKAAAPLGDPQPLKPLAEEQKVLEAVVPSWMGIEFRPLSDAAREETGLMRGAVTVQGVVPGSPAERAGFRVGDVVLGPPGQPFDEPRLIREWTMFSPQGEALPLEVVRGAERIRLAITLTPLPVEWPRIPGPPPVGAKAPPLAGLRTLAGRRPLALSGKAHLLFFWATWCGPCKKAVPELLGWSRSAGLPVVAVSDEDPKVLEEFLRKRSEPFPELVVSDVLRQSYAAYGISGTPTFILVGSEGTIRFRQVGYDEGRGLEIDGWRRPGRKE